MPVVLRTTPLLTLSNLFMTFAWYAHLKDQASKPWYVAALVSWAIALLVFIPFAVLYMKQPVKLDYLWAALCVLGAVFFMFRAQS
jgi:uncharacterized protein (DUF486 family)